MARIGVDCDGVLASFVDAFCALATEKLGRPIVPERWTDWGGGGQFTKKEEKEMWYRIRATPNWWLSTPAIEVNVRALARWLAKSTAQDVWVVTSRAKTMGLSAAAQTMQWLEACGVRPYYNHLGVITVPDSDDKLDICSRLDIRWIVDDKVETIESFDRYPYMNAAMLDQPWNQRATPKWRVKTLAEFLERIK